MGGGCRYLLNGTEVLACYYNAGSRHHQNTEDKDHCQFFPVILQDLFGMRYIEADLQDQVLLFTTSPFGKYCPQYIQIAVRRSPGGLFSIGFAGGGWEDGRRHKLLHNRRAFRYNGAATIKYPDVRLDIFRGMMFSFQIPQQRLLIFRVLEHALDDADFIP